MTREDLIEIMAESIYHTRYKEIDEVVLGKFHKLWKTEQYSTIPDDFVLSEHERDDYRHEARDVLDVILKNIDTINELLIKEIIE
jgi:hypothetical protein